MDRTTMIQAHSQWTDTANHSSSRSCERRWTRHWTDGDTLGPQLALVTIQDSASPSNATRLWTFPLQFTERDRRKDCEVDKGTRSLTVSLNFKLTKFICNTDGEINLKRLFYLERPRISLKRPGYIFTSIEWKWEFRSKLIAIIEKK